MRNEFTNELRAETLLAIDAVERGLQMSGRGVNRSEVTSKGKLDLVTTMDVAIEDLIRSLVANSDLAVVGEENGGDAPDSAPYWLLDPICGTGNYASGIPLYCVNLALVEEGEIALAVVGDPSTGDIHIAERGRGAWAMSNGAFRTLAVSDESEIVIIEVGRATGRRREAAARFTARAIRAERWDLRALSTTLALPYVAAGRVSAYVLFQATALHSGAGTLLSVEAGAVVTDIAGEPWRISSDSVVAAATPELHDELLGLRI